MSRCAKCIRRGGAQRRRRRLQLDRDCARFAATTKDARTSCQFYVAACAVGIRRFARSATATTYGSNDRRSCCAAEFRLVFAGSDGTRAIGGATQHADCGADVQRCADADGTCACATASQHDASGQRLLSATAATAAAARCTASQHGRRTVIDDRLFTDRSELFTDKSFIFTNKSCFRTDRRTAKHVE